MPVRIQNLLPEFLAFWEVAKNRSVEEKKELWLNLYENPYRSVFDTYYSQWGNPNGLEEALKRFPAVVPTLRQINLEESIRRAIAACRHLFQMPEPDFEYVVMVGLFSSNGWATIFQGRPTSFLALEWFSNQKYFDVLVSHEAAHTFHTLVRTGDWPQWHIGQAMFDEGLATLVSAEVCPSLSEDEYLWFGSGYGDWLASCLDQSEEVLAPLRTAASCSDESVYKRFFMGGPKDTVPVRSGYWAGYRVLCEMRRHHTVAEMARWSGAQAEAAIQEVLGELL